MNQPKPNNENIFSEGFSWRDSTPSLTHNYLLPTVMDELTTRCFNPHESDKFRIFDLGCGNGSFANSLSRAGWNVMGVDPSKDGITIANQAFPNLNLFIGSGYDDLVDLYGKFNAVISLEVIEHLYSPKIYVSKLYDLLEPDGVAIISTPYHGYWKNMAISLLGAWDAHFTALWDHGHIKFWSPRTLTSLLTEAGFRVIKIVKVGRIPLFAKSMIIVAER